MDKRGFNRRDRWKIYRTMQPDKSSPKKVCIHGNNPYDKLTSPLGEKDYVPMEQEAEEDDD